MKKNIVNGWLDREGRLHPCKFNHHARASIVIQKKLGSKHSPEYLGWVKVHCAGVFFFEAASWHGRQYMRVTQKQKKWLFNNDYDMFTLRE